MDERVIVIFINLKIIVLIFFLIMVCIKIKIFWCDIFLNFYNCEFNLWIMGVLEYFW